MRKQDLGAVLAVAAAYAAMMAVEITCPIKFLTGVSCAGCGMSRAWLSLLRLDLPAAFAYHPLFWLPVPAAAAFFFRKKLPRRVWNGGVAAVCALALTVYVLRLLNPEDTVVVFQPTHGFIYHLLSRVLGR